MKPIRMVYQTPGNYGEFQSLYLDREANWLQPNLTFLYADGSLCFETNEIGLKGDAVDPSRKLAVVWGDSVVFGIGRGWPCLLDELVPGYQFLNGGIEGDTYDRVLQRALKLNRERAIELNIILLGWHHRNNRNVRVDLTAAVESIPNPVLVTMPTPINCHIVDKDLSAYLEPHNTEEGFRFHGSDEYSIALQQQIFEHILERNAITREVAEAIGLPLVDLFTFFDTTLFEDFRLDFFDTQHPRRSAYPKMARAIYEGIKPVLGLT